MLPALQKELVKISAGEFSPYYIVHGDDDYLISAALNQLMDAFLPHSDRDFGFAIYDCDLAAEQEIVEALQSVPLLPVHKVVVLKNFPFFRSKTRSGNPAKKFWEYWETDKEKAAQEFCSLLAGAGYSAEVMMSEGWRKIEAREWSKILGEDVGNSQEILVKIAEIVTAAGFQLPKSGGVTSGRIHGWETPSPPHRSVIFVTNDWDKNNKLFLKISANAAVFAFEKPKTATQQKTSMQEVVRELLAEAQKKIPSNTLEAIAEKVGFESSEVISAVNKLITFVGDRETITTSDVESVIGRTKKEAIFELSSALSKRNVTRALSQLGELLERGEHQQTILAVITREVRMLLHAKLFAASGKISPLGKGCSYQDFVQKHFASIKALSQETAEDLLGGHPYVSYLAFQNSHFFPMEVLVKSLHELSAMDITFKSSPRNPRLQLEHFIVGFCSS
ncbi:MAG: hypothetical protein K9K75_01840 [Deltaproteobacteria bacterium]|nr:hypothetical protein [Deltaproteobacteria bacterium]